MRRWLFFLLALPSVALCGQWSSVTPRPGAGALHFYSSQPGNGQATSALVVVHGFPHDALRTFNAGVAASPDAVVIAPLFQANDPDRCQHGDEPRAVPGELVWTCSGWMQGEPAINAPQVNAFVAMDALIAEVHLQWPSVRTITVAGFSAGAQMVQHYIAFAAPQPGLRFVAADPGTWLYFKGERPYAVPHCPGVNQWKYGTQGLPAWLPGDADAAWRRYASAEVHYLAGSLDTGDAKGTAYRLLDRSCAAMAQGPYRLERARAFTQAVGQPLIEVPGCAHDVRCVFESAQGRAVLAP